MASKTRTKAAAKTSAPSTSSPEKDTTEPTGEVTPDTKTDAAAEETVTDASGEPVATVSKDGPATSSPEEPVVGEPTGEVTDDTKTDAGVPDAADTAPLNDNTEAMRVADSPEDFEGAGQVAPEEKARNEKIEAPAAEAKGTTNEVAPTPYAETSDLPEGRFDQTEAARHEHERVPARSENTQGRVVIDSNQLPVGSAPSAERVKRDAPSDLPIEDGGLASPAEPKNEAEGFKGAAAVRVGSIMAPGAPLEPPAAPATADADRDGADARTPSHPGELGAAMIRENRPGSRLLDARTGEAPDADSLFESASQAGTSLRCTVRLVQHTFVGPQGRPLRQLVMTQGQVVGPEKAKQVVAILKAQLEYDAAHEDAAAEDAAKSE